MAGYSGTPLAKKLGVRAGDRVFLDTNGHLEGAAARSLVFAADAPVTANEVQLLTRLASDLDVAVTFHISSTALRARVRQLQDRITDAGMLWIAWPKRASSVPTDITEDRLREWFLPDGLLVDVKVCAIDETWSGLKFVIRKERRGDAR